jgi:hypothetical protein
MSPKGERDTRVEELIALLADYAERARKVLVQELPDSRMASAGRDFCLVCSVG